MNAQKTAKKLEDHFNYILSLNEALVGYRVHLVSSKRDLFEHHQGRLRTVAVEATSIDLLELFQKSGIPAEVFDGKTRRAEMTNYRIMLYQLIKDRYGSNKRLGELVAKIFRIDRTSTYHYAKVAKYVIKENQEIYLDLCYRLGEKVEKIIKKNFSGGGS